MKRRKVALMGLTGEGVEYLDALRSEVRFDLIGIADTDTDALRRCAETTGIRAFDDYRSLVVETAHAGLDFLFVAIEPFQSVEFVKIAAAHGIGVFHKAPFARNFREAQQIVSQFEDGRCPLIVARSWLSHPALAGLDQLGELAGHVYAATAHVETVDTPDGWRGHSAQAGGGVLLNGAYETLDMLIHLLGPARSVHTRCTVAVVEGAPRKHDTEDVAIVSLDLGGERVACLTAVRGATEPHETIVLYGTDGTIEIRDKRMTITPEVSDSADCFAAESDSPAGHAIRTFSTALLADTQRPPSTGVEHLLTMAAIEAAYLSARTGAPESPDRFTTSQSLA